jgi:hypothetical protein
VAVGWRRANELLRLASADFAKAELNRRSKEFYGVRKVWKLFVAPGSFEG